MSEFCVELVVVVTMVSCLMGLDIWLLFVRSLLPGVGNGGSVLFGGGAMWNALVGLSSAFWTTHFDCI